MTDNSMQHGSDPASQSPDSQPKENVIARNEPCPCGSGKKYKRCHGVAAAPKLSQPRPSEAPAEPGGAGANGLPPGMEHVTPEMMGQVSSMLQRLPKGQLQRLQSIMQRAMSGKDVSREAEEFQKTLPAEFQQMLMTMMPAAAMAAQAQGTAPAGGGTTAITASGMSEDEARRIVAEAAASGKISSDQATELLKASEGDASSDRSKGIGKLWRNFTKK